MFLISEIYFKAFYLEGSEETAVLWNAGRPITVQPVMNYNKSLSNEDSVRHA